MDHRPGAGLRRALSSLTPATAESKTALLSSRSARICSRSLASMGCSSIGITPVDALSGQSPTCGAKQQMPAEKIPVGGCLQPKALVEKESCGAHHGSRKCVDECAEDEEYRYGKIGRSAVCLSEKNQLGALILDTRRTAKAIGGLPADVGGACRGEIINFCADAAGAPAPFDFFEEKEVILV